MRYDIKKNETSTGICLSNDSMYISNGGIASETIVKAGGSMRISSGGVAKTAFVSSGGNVSVFSSGSAESVTVSSGGKIYFYNGFATDLTLLAGGILGGFSFTEKKSFDRIESGSALVAPNVLIHSAQMSVADGGSVNGVTINSGASMRISSGGAVTNTLCDEGNMHILTGGNAEKNTLSGGSMYISGGAATSTTIAAGGHVIVSSGGTANSNTVEELGNIHISNGGTASRTTVSSGGFITVFSGGTAQSATVNAGGSMYVVSGGAVSDLTLKKGGILGGFTFQTDKTFSDTVDGLLTSDNLHIIENNLVVTQGDLIGNINVNSGGVLHVSSGGTVSGFIILQSGVMNVSSGGVAQETAVSAGGSMYISSGGSAFSTDICEEGFMEVSSGGVVSVTTVDPLGNLILAGGMAKQTVINGYLDVCSGGSALQTTVQTDGAIYVSSGGAAENITIRSGGFMCIYSGGILRGSLDMEDGADVSMDDGAIVDFFIAGMDPSNGYMIENLSVFAEHQLSYSITVKSGQTAGTYLLAQEAMDMLTSVSVTVGDGTVDFGSVAVNEGVRNFNGMDYQLTESEGNLQLVLSVNAAGAPELTVTGMSDSWTNTGFVLSASGSPDANLEYSMDGKNWSDGSLVEVNENKTFYFRATDTSGNASVKSVVVENIDTTVPDLPGAFTETVAGFNAELDWQDVTDSGSGVSGYYFRYGTTADLTGDGSFTAESTFSLSELVSGVYYYQVRTADHAGNISGWSEVRSFEIEPGKPENLQGDARGISWNAVPGAGQGYVAEYSTDDFEHVLTVETPTAALDSYGLPSGSYQWHVRLADGEKISEGPVIVSQKESAAQEFVSDSDSVMDLFFASAGGVWNSSYAAQHCGILDLWEGTQESVSLWGKNILADTFEGCSSDMNILVLTDDSNGDALFVDDIYTALPGTVTEQQSRIARINEIRAGAGDDIVDMTSQRFAYAGDGVKIYGGSGDDIIWANNGENKLFGDAGNDRLVGGTGNDVIMGGNGNDSMHGGGGEDLFCFGAGWGADRVEQLSGGSVTLWFAEGEEAQWDRATLTYTDGSNSVTISGISADAVTLKFGDDDSLLYDELVSAGCFGESVSAKIFEDKNTGILA